MDAAELKNRIAVNVKGDTTDDGIGGVTFTSTIVYMWAAVKVMPPKERMYYGIESTMTAYNFIVRYLAGKDITTADTITFNNVNYRIIAVEDINQDHKYIKIMTGGHQ